MKNFKYLLIIVVAIVLSASCSDDGDDGGIENVNVHPLVGSWEVEFINKDFISHSIWTYKADLTVTHSGWYIVKGIRQEKDVEHFTWSTDGDKLEHIHTESQFLDVFTYSISGNTLTLTGIDAWSGVLERM